MISNQLQENNKNRKSLAYLISHTEILVCFEFADQFHPVDNDDKLWEAK